VRSKAVVDWDHAPSVLPPLLGVGRSGQHADFVRPTKRFDLGKLTSKRLSGSNAFGFVRENCSADFARM
jgi:hypothetical protein